MNIVIAILLTLGWLGINSAKNVLNSAPGRNGIYGQTDDGLDLPKCDDIDITVRPKNAVYNCSDSVEILVKDIDADSVAFSIGLEGYLAHKGWDPVIYDVKKFAKSGKIKDDLSGVVILHRSDSISIVLHLNKLKGVYKRYTKWRFFVYGHTFYPRPDFTCLSDFDPFVIK